MKEQRPAGPEGPCARRRSWKHARTPKGARHGGDRIRTDDPLLAKQVLSQLSYAPTDRRSGGFPPRAGMGQGGLEPPTPRLSSVCSNQLSYWPPGLGAAEVPRGASLSQGQTTEWEKDARTAPAPSGPGRPAPPPASGPAAAESRDSPGGFACRHVIVRIGAKPLASATGLKPHP